MHDFAVWIVVNLFDVPPIITNSIAVVWIYLGLIIFLSGICSWGIMIKGWLKGSRI